MDYWKRTLNVIQVAWLVLTLITVTSGGGLLNMFILYGFGLGIIFALGYLTTGKWEVWYFTANENSQSVLEPEEDP